MSQWLVMVCSALSTLTYDIWITWFPILNEIQLPHDEKRMVSVTMITMILGIFASIIFSSERPQKAFLDVLKPISPKVKNLILAIVLGALYLLVELVILVLIL